MTNLVFVGEGQTEESFARDVLAIDLVDQNVLVDPRLIRTSAYGRGGALSWGRVRRFLRNTLRERADTYVTTFFDLYHLDNDFPGWHEAQAHQSPLHRASEIERHFHAAVIAEAGCRAERFIPHVQPHEFEALLFSNVEAFVDIESHWQAHVASLRSARSAFESPEHINDGQTTHPSARLRSTLRHPTYQKVLHGVAVVRRIGLARVREECSHFREWIARIEKLKPLN